MTDYQTAIAAIRTAQHATLADLAELQAAPLRSDGASLYSSSNVTFVSLQWFLRRLSDLTDSLQADDAKGLPFDPNAIDREMRLTLAEFE